MNNGTVKVYNRRLEQVLYYLGQKWISQDKTDQGMSYWVYPKTDKVLAIVKWFNESAAKHEKVA